MNTLLLSMMLMFNTVATQTHTPTATVAGDVVTVNADFAWVDPAVGAAIVVPVSIVEGTILMDRTQLASYDGKKPVSWQLPPGSYKVTAFGYPDNRMFPMRTKVILDVTILSPTRQQQIADALKAYSIAIADAAAAKTLIQTLKPTKAELAAALAP